MSRPSGKGGFTLLELAIVLAILGVLTMLATREIGQVQDQQRFEASQRGLDTIREDVWGSPDDRAPDGSGVRAGFVADVGRLPDRLDELWTNTTGLGAFAVTKGVEDSEVRVSGGWRGPYVRLSWNATNLLDGWGNAYTSRLETGVWKVGHLGADGAEGGTNYDQEVFIDFKENEAKAWVWGQVEVNTNLLAGSNATVRVRVFHPDGTSEEISGLSSACISTNVISWTNSVPVPIGLRPVRAYLVGTDRKSAIRYVSLRSGTNGPVFLEIN